MRRKPDQHLSQAGVSLARRIGETMGPFQRVITSSIPRAYETAIAMGFAVDEQAQELCSMPDDVMAEIEWDAGFAAWGAMLHRKGTVLRFIQMQVRFLHSVAKLLPDNAAALIVTHGGFAEAGAVGCLPHREHAAWGSYIDYCEGIRLHYDVGDFTNIEILRVEAN